MKDFQQKSGIKKGEMNVDWKWKCKPKWNHGLKVLGYRKSVPRRDAVLAVKSWMKQRQILCMEVVRSETKIIEISGENVKNYLLLFYFPI